jgi:hypothetical protein
MRIVAFLLSLVLSNAAAEAFDCAGVTFPSTVVLCSDPELKQLADERQVAINEARVRIGEGAWPTLWEDPKALGSVLCHRLRRAPRSATA